MLQPGQRLGDRYRLDVRIGAGGMGEVWRATDEVLGRVVAVKVMLASVAADPGFARRFLTEAKAMAGVNHPAVASIHDYGTSDGAPFLVMEYVDGESLAQLLTRHGRLTAAQTMLLVAQAAEGLRAVHDRGIVHRDIKPANLLVRRDGTLLISDFGIARIDGATALTTPGAVLGTPTYLAPEQVLGRPATPLSDLYSLGLTAYECLAGHRPFTGDNPYAVALQRVQGAPRTLAGDLPGEVLAVVERSLAPDPADRWPSAAALASAARTAATAIPHPADPAPHDAHPPARPPRERADLPAPPADHAAHPPGPPAGHAAHPPGPPVDHGAQPAGPPAGHAAHPPAPPADHAAHPAGRPARDDARQAAKRRRTVAAAAVAVVLLGLGAFGAWWATGDDDSPRGNAPRGPGLTTAAGAGGKNAVPRGFAACGAGLCPTSAACWDGTVAISGKAAPPGERGCGEDHYWETFAALPMPSGADGVRQDGLMGRRDVAAACSAAVMAGRSRDPEATAGWRRDAWPLQVDGGWVLLCIAGSDTGETTGSAFRPAAK
ncbi:serine/threonine-protein kinase [Pseudosporangium ferrugineum]|uniref:non-specific serine/threonine protein kinase n=1 Tax=Pseudosporangium ferrugineum TaxID=439699 RepID=A0A2T0SI87_9ACTN|nr:serine/threonine-protein kinase [Pseudosporangium ferrugineum]PRY33131.1 serine/threonine-protein kinase [Pseudosporangium ferrugineum]